MSDLQYKNLLINKTFEPLLMLIICGISLAFFLISLFIYKKSNKKDDKIERKIAKDYMPILPVKKPDEGMKTKYSDEHLIVTSNIKEKLKIFEKNKKN